jgi:hypothetical protein
VPRSLKLPLSHTQVSALHTGLMLIHCSYHQVYEPSKSYKDDRERVFWGEEWVENVNVHRPVSPCT